MNTTTVYLKRSQFIVGLVKTLRGLIGDTRVLFWVLRRNNKVVNYLTSTSIKKLQLGTSNNVLKGWLNTDVRPSHDSVVYLDATRRFPFEDDTFDYVVAEHMIEHIDYDAAQSMLRECFRVLKPGGRVRFATPDLNVLLALHSGEKTGIQKEYIDWAVAQFMPAVQNCKDVFVINNFFRAWGHSFLYDADTLHHALSAVGFRNVKFYKPGVSEDPQLQNLEWHGRELGSETINQFESIVIEGNKER